MKRLHAAKFILAIAFFTFEFVNSRLSYAADEGLIAYYSFSGSAVDASGHGNDGMVSGASLTTDRFGQSGNAYLFDGINDQIIVPHDSEFDYSGTNTLSISAWIFLNTFKSNASIVCKSDVNGVSNYCLPFPWDARLAPAINHFGGSTCEHIVANSYLETGIWHHIVVIYDHQNISLFINGALDNQGTYNSTPSVNSAPVCFGNDTDGNSEFFDGKLDEIRFYNRTLSESEIKELADDKLPGVLFTDIQAGLTGAGYYSASEWGDYDNDGDLDLVLSGRLTGDAGKVTQIYNNQGNGRFIDIQAGLPGLWGGDVAWADYDNDAYLDLLVTGYKGEYGQGFEGLTKIYQNQAGTFIDIHAPMEQIFFSNVEWGDYDNDGDLDLFILGILSQNPLIRLTPKIYRNDHGAFVETDISFPIIAIGGKVMTWIDYDVDGDLDIAIGCRNPDNSMTAPKIFRNDGDDLFTEVPSSFAYGYDAEIQWGDYNMDGWPDVFICANLSGYGSYAKIYQNNHGSFADIGAPIDQLGGDGHRAVWGDYDSDGDLDLLQNGFKSHHPETELYRNDNGVFTELTPAFVNLDQTYAGAISWGDFNADGRLDVLMNAEVVPSGNTRISKIFNNNILSKNSAPQPPSNLNHELIGNDIVLRWDEAADAETSNPGLTYNLRIGTSAGGCEIKSPMADLVTGKRRIANFGNAGYAKHWILKGLQEGVTYFWSVQAIDNSFEGSTFSREQTFSLNQPPIASAGGPYHVDEGSEILLTGQGNDPDNDPLDYSWDLDYDGIFEMPGQTATFSAIRLDGTSIHHAAVKVMDEHGLYAIAYAEIAVANVAPEITLLCGPLDPQSVGACIQMTAAFSDPGLMDTHTTHWQWGDGSSNEQNIQQPAGSGQIIAEHIYTTAGVYTVQLSLTDDDGAKDQAIFHYVVIYNVGAGFVSGGGWITSPPGAYITDPSLTGKANFGFVSKYQKGANVPTGQTQFQFKTANLNFNSTEYQWLVIAGAKAKYKGWGKINDSGEYGFQLSAIDGQYDGGTEPDRLRLKIWEKLTGNVVYDNQLGADEEADADCCIGGGSIVIHKYNSLSKELSELTDVPMPEIFALHQNFPNPFNPSTTINYQLPQESDMVIEIFNIRGELVKTLLDQRQAAGFHAITWDATDLKRRTVSGGVYLYRMQSDAFTKTMRMLLLK